MAILKSFPWLRERIRIHLTEWGYDVQVYGQTVMRASTFREATRLATALRRALSKKLLSPGTDAPKSEAHSHHRNGGNAKDA